MLKKILAMILRFIHREELLLRLAENLDPQVIEGERVVDPG